MGNQRKVEQEEKPEDMIPGLEEALWLGVIYMVSWSLVGILILSMGPLMDIPSSTVSRIHDLFFGLMFIVYLLNLWWRIRRYEKAREQEQASED